MSLAQTTPSLVETQDLSVWLGQRHVLAGVSMAARAGQWLSIVGPNGAGKSTLLRALAGLDNRLEPRAGAVRRHGSVAWMGQNEPCPDDFNAREVVMLGRWPHQSWLGAASAADEAAVADALAQVDATALAERRMAQLSGGERQRVLLARALAVQADLLLLDEPLAHLDPPHQLGLLHTLRGLCQQGKAVVTVVHELSWALHADQLLVLHQGRAVHHGPRTDAATHRAVEAAFGHAVRLQAEPGGDQVSVRLNLG